MAMPDRRQIQEVRETVERMIDKAVTPLQTSIAQNKAQIEALKKRVEALEARLPKP
jgi:polyhydroxyalkanoate synthesis regulator phasin